MTERDSYYIFKPEFPKLEILRKFILKGQVDQAVHHFKAVNFDPNAYIKGSRPGVWVPLLYQAFQDKRMMGLIKVLINRGGKVNKLPDGDDEAPPLIFVCDAMYIDYLYKQGLRGTGLTPIYQCFLYGKYEHLKKLTGLAVIAPADIEKVQAAYPDLLYSMLDTGVKYLTYYYGAQVKKGDENANLKKCTDDIIARYVGCLDFLDLSTIDQKVVDLCAKYYLYEILTRLRLNFKPGFTCPVNYGDTGAKEALLRPLLNDYRYEQTCKILKVRPDPVVYQGYNRN
jgi:hypothetical protein